MRIGIITIGNELLSGFTLDRNAAWIGQQLLSLGMKVDVHHTISDEVGTIYDTLEYQWKSWECDHIIVTGGLGPTVDDVTVSAFLEYFDDSHEFDKEYWSVLSDRFKKLNFKMPNLNKNQAYKSKKGKMIDNLVGTARGLHYTKEHASFFKGVSNTIKGKQRNVNFFALPGVPKEMKSMFSNYVLPEIEKTNANKIVCKTIRTTAIPESILQEKITDLIEKSNDCDVAFLPHRMLGVDIRLTSENEVAIKDLEERILDRIGKYVYGFDNDTIEKVVADQLLNKNLTIATAESCTAGMLSAKLTEISGSSNYFNGGVVCYNNDIKSDVVGVKNDILEKYGAVSEEVASELASGIAKKLNSDIGVGITGIAGPTGGTEKKPVGLIFVGIFYKNNVYIKQYNLTPNRKVNRELTVVLCLNELRKILEKD